MEAGDWVHLPILSNQLRQSNQVSQRAEFKGLPINATWDTCASVAFGISAFLTLRQKRLCSVFIPEGKTVNLQ